MTTPAHTCFRVGTPGADYKPCAACDERPTNPKTRTLREWQAEVHQRNRDKGFYDYEQHVDAVKSLLNRIYKTGVEQQGNQFISVSVSLNDYWALVHLVKDYEKAAIERKLLLVIGEVCEAHEELRAGHGLTEVYTNPGSNKPEGVPVELADAQIRLLDVQAACGNDSETAIALKHKFNGTREHKHGKSF